MMLAAPVRSSAWSSTNRTLARFVATAEGSAGRSSVVGMDLGWKLLGFPRHEDFVAAARGGDDGQRGADAVGTFLHARHAEAVRPPLPRNATPVVRNREPQ